MTDLLDLMRAPPVKVAVDPDGPVIQGDVDETLALPHRRLAWDQARIELHRHSDGLWMWSTSFNLEGEGGSGYRVGPKWGNFAATRDDALHWAIAEMRDRIGDGDHKAAKAILNWMGGLR